ncbi:MAG: AmmeMemoRadiSam system radical SAM enzyme [Bacteroidales bacterium]
MEPLYVKSDRYIQCRLCPHLCKISVGKKGICGVRKNTGEKIALMTYGVLSGCSSDPVEKKPLYHFFPGSSILSVGSYGCNLRCDFCQNWHISQNTGENFRINTSPLNIVEEALAAKDNIGLAFTYNEPVIWFEFMKDTAVMIRDKGLYTVLVSNGYVNEDPLREIISFTDAFNIDLKAFNPDFYKKLTGADIGPVKNSLKMVSRAGRHLEVTTLIIPERNDSDREMEDEAKWIAGELGNETPLHLSRYFPMYKRQDPATPQSTLDRLFEVASKHLRYVYLGNAGPGRGQNTSCSRCGATVTKRSGYSIRLLNLDSGGKCTTCGNEVYRNFRLPSPTGR